MEKDYFFKPYWDVDDLCDFLGVKRATMMKLIQKEKLGFEVIRIGGRYRISRLELIKAGIIKEEEKEGGEG